MMKKVIKKIINKLGFDIIRYQRPLSQIEVKDEVRKSKKTDLLKLHFTSTGKYYLPVDALDDYVANTIISNKIFDLEVVKCAEKYIKPGTVVLDIGSNYGQMSILFSKMTGDKGKVYSFDADDFIFEILKKNIAVNQATNIYPIFGAVHDVAGVTLIFPEQDFERFGAYGSYGIDYNGDKKGRQVTSLTIDSLNIQDKISFVKIDVQGGDLFAMKGAIETIKRHKMPILFEFEYLFQDDMHLDFQEYVDFVNQINYKFERVINGHNFLILPKNN